MTPDEAALLGAQCDAIRGIIVRALSQLEPSRVELSRLLELIPDKECPGALRIRLMLMELRAVAAETIVQGVAQHAAALSSAGTAAASKSAGSGAQVLPFRPFLVPASVTPSQSEISETRPGA
ncbi:hypothetical protein HB662_19820 [Roseomonas frigidaquae]|uniref:Uncharacterized protein n=1 Tax=Falsiroseomonas frigidaquae TaxID=487318 RepID=A0ABX1F3Y4_9PROT|nr:hypothetical protein [Falsiroseomonas frigidaquae]NKE47038.1 hypothetical protein [Falsiroseomonas frigidaquae]